MADCSGARVDADPCMDLRVFALQFCVDFALMGILQRFRQQVRPVIILQNGMGGLAFHDKFQSLMAG